MCPVNYALLPLRVTLNERAGSSPSHVANCRGALDSTLNYQESAAGAAFTSLVEQLISSHLTKASPSEVSGSAVRRKTHPTLGTGS